MGEKKEKEMKVFWRGLKRWAVGVWGLEIRFLNKTIIKNSKSSMNSGERERENGGERWDALADVGAHCLVVGGVCVSFGHG